MAAPRTIYDAFPLRAADADASIGCSSSSILTMSTSPPPNGADPTDLHESLLSARSSVDRNLLASGGDRLSASMCSRFGKFHGDVFETTERAGMLSVLKRRRRALASKKQHRILEAAATFAAEDVVRSGLLTKQGSWRHNWKTRFFLLRKDVPSLCYYKSEEKLTLLGAIPITADSLVMDKSSKGQSPFRFQIRTDDMSLLLETESRGNQLRWIDACQQLADALREEQFRRSRLTNPSALSHASSSVSTNTSMSSSAQTIHVTVKSMDSRCQTPPVAVSDSETDSNAPSYSQSEQDAMYEGGLSCCSYSSDEDEDDDEEYDDDENDRENAEYRNDAHADQDPSTAVQDDQSLHANDQQTAAQHEQSSSRRSRAARQHDIVLRLQCGSGSATKMLTREGTSIETAGFFLQIDGIPREETAAPVELGVTDVIKVASSSSVVVPFSVVLTLDLSHYAFLHMTLFKCSLQQGPGYAQTCVGGGRLALDDTFVRHGQVGSIAVRSLLADRIQSKKTRVDPHEEVEILAQAFASVSPKIVLPTTGIDMASAKYVLPTTSLTYDGSPPCIAVDEILRVPRSTFALPLAFLAFLERHLCERIQEAEQRMSPRPNMDSISAFELAYYHRQRDANRQQRQFLQREQMRLGDELTNGTVFRSMQAQVGRRASPATRQSLDERGVSAPFKRSTAKSEALWQMLPTNMHNQFLCVPPAPTAPLVWHTMTMGCPAAHTKGFSHVTTPDDAASNPNPATSTTDEDSITLSNVSAGSAGRASRDCSVTALKRRLEHEERVGIIGCQILSAAVACMLASIELAALGSRYHILQLEQAAKIGFLVQFESLLSTQGKELGMLEDFATAAQWLRRVSVRFCEHEITGEHFVIDANDSSLALNMMNADADGNGGSSSNSANRVFVTIGLRAAHMSILPPRLAEGKACRMRCVLFTQGVNEKQTLMHAIKGTAVKVQERVNRDNFAELQTLFLRFCRYHGYDPTHATRRRTPAISNLSFQALEDLLAQIEQHLSSSSAQFKKNVALLLATADFCRSLGAARVTCCKSGKDRTAMSVTLEQARMCCRTLDALDVKRVCANMRIFGVRRKNVVLNTRNTTFAFNEMQRKLLPDCYQPPAGTYRSGKS